MTRLLLIFTLLAGLAACGADGDPIPPGDKDEAKDTAAQANFTPGPFEPL